MASLYRRGQVWWSKSYVAGKMVRTSIGTRDKAEARHRLRERESQAVGKAPSKSMVVWETAAQDLLAYYRPYGTRNAVGAEGKLKQLTRYFAGIKLGNIDAAAILGYVNHRLKLGRAAATINVELATLRRALCLAREHKKLDDVPVIRMLRPAEPRSEFFQREQFEAVARGLPDDLALVIRVGYVYGWRLSSEVLTLTKAQIDLHEGTLRLEAGKTKNRDGRLVYLTPELQAAIADQLSRVKVLEREMGAIVPWLFPHLRGKRQGERITSFRKRWATACVKAGCPGMLRHDLRRTAVRNLVNAGVPTRTAMLITGHRSMSVFTRYHIVSPGDLRDAIRRLSALAAHSGDSDKTTYNLGTSGD
jgi:integrase